MSAALDHTAELTETYATVPLGAQFRGMARDIRRRISIEDTQYDQLINALVQPVKDRLRRYPHRSLRPQMLVDLIQRWRFMPCRDWRLSLDAKLDKNRASMIEHRLVAGCLRCPDDPNWVGMEDDVAIIRVQLDVNRSRAHLESQCVAAISLHALARRIQRHPDGTIEALMHDINLVAQAVRGELVAGAGYRVRTSEDGGGWRGRVITQIAPGEVERNVLSVRTWLER